MTGIVDSFAPGLFAGRGVLVTGGTSGIGLGAAFAFRDLGASVVATGATDSECERARVDAANSRVAFERLDVREAAAIGALIERLPRLDAVVNAAGVIRRDIEHDPDSFAEVVAINLTGTMRVCSAAKAKLAANGGSVVKPRLNADLLRRPARAGLQRLEGRHRAAHEEPRGGSEGVRVNVRSRRAGSRRRSRRLCGRTRRRARPSSPARRWRVGARPEEVAGGIVFLASPAGAILAIDGGYMAV
jgi:NAD(P)-dependent dehydrogenase (short-subunit alcohol dehydrogenase family)